jgi:hypothetical protein
MVYRILRNEGYMYRMRIYHLTGNCSSEIENIDDIESHFDEVRDFESNFTSRKHE